MNNLYIYGNNEDTYMDFMFKIFNDSNIMSVDKYDIIDMNIYSNSNKRIEEIDNWYKNIDNSSKRINLILFLTEFLDFDLESFYELQMIRRLVMEHDVNLKVVIDDEKYEYFSDRKSFYSWIFKKSDMYYINKVKSYHDISDSAMKIMSDILNDRLFDVCGDFFNDDLFNSWLTTIDGMDCYMHSVVNAYKSINENGYYLKNLMLYLICMYIESVCKDNESKCDILHYIQGSSVWSYDFYYIHEKLIKTYLVRICEKNKEILVRKSNLCCVVNNTKNIVAENLGEYSDDNNLDENPDIENTDDETE